MEQLDHAGICEGELVIEFVSLIWKANFLYCFESSLQRSIILSQIQVLSIELIP